MKVFSNILHIHFVVFSNPSKKQVKMENARIHLSHCALFFQFFGLQYFSVSSLTSENKKENPSLAYKIYFFIIFFVIVAQTLLFISNASSDDVQMVLNTKTILNYVVQHSMYMFLVIIICVSIISSYLSTTFIKTLYLNCMLISKICNEDFNYTLDYRKSRRNIFKYLLICIIIFVASELLLHLFDWFFDKPRSFTKSCLTFFPMIFLNFIAFKFIFYVNLVNYQLEPLYFLIGDIFKPPLTIAQNFNYYVKPIKLNKSLKLSQKIRSLRKIYNIISKNAEIINRSMGVPVLTLIALMVIAITASGYRIFLVAVGKFPIEKIGGEDDLIFT